MDRSALEQVFSFGSQFSPAMALGFRITLIAALAWFAVILSHRMIRAFRLFISKNLADAEEVKRAATLGRVFRYIASVIISLITVTLILSELGISIAPILGAAGVVGVAVGFGAQSLVKDYFTGFFLLLENQIRQGDAIQAGGKAGVVEEITLRFVRMRDYDGNVHFVPNGTITTVTNMTRGHAHAVVDVGVAYRENVDQALEIMRQTGAELRADPAFAAKILEEVEIVGVEAIRRLYCAAVSKSHRSSNGEYAANTCAASNMPSTSLESKFRSRISPSILVRTKTAPVHPCTCRLTSLKCQKG